MRILITDMPGSKPVELRRLNAVLLAASDDTADGAAPCVAHGTNQQLAHLAAVILISIRTKIGSAAFESVVRGARSSKQHATDITHVVQEPKP